MEHYTGTIIMIVIGIVMSAYFSATETAFSSLNKIRIKNLAEKGNKKADLVLRLANNYDNLLSTILIGNNIVNIASASLATVFFVKLLGDERGPSVSTAVITVAVLIFGEVTPKSIAKETPERFAMFSAPFLHVLSVVLTPFNFLFAKWKKLISRVVKSPDDSGITDEELLSIVEEAKEEGAIDEQENMFIKSALEFTDQEAIDILTPRIDITAVSTETTKEELAEIFAETGYSRLPVYEDTVDHIIGIIYQKDFYNSVMYSGKEIADIIRPALFIPKNKKIGVLLNELQQKKIHIAVVLDEFGGTVGIVTMEDILEELVGEIWDEYDAVDSAIEQKSDTEYIVSGSADVDEVFETLEIEYSKEEQSGIINGWIMNELDRVPEKGDAFEYKGYRITVLEMNENRVEKVLFARMETESPAPQEE